ncbi:unnamed protein product [Rotaria sordida]|uniref:F-box domain-containing protein n=1 Tax=Rotaria sordida TaxID=392033 RepID=A0A819J187_9BILA|nr:unnamed protein product [Rotaria sordida]
MTQNKRQRYSLTDNCNDDIKKKKLQSTSLFSSITSNTYKSSINQFENLSNEVIYEIFEFLNVYQLYESFFDLNTRFRNLCIYSNLPIEINNQSLSKSTFQRYYTNLILPNKHRIRSLDLSDPFIIDFFSLSTEDISKYFQLQTLILEKMESGYLENLLTSLTSLPNLSSLIISIGLGSTTNTLWNLIFQLPVLKYCKISSEENIYLGFLPMSTHTHTYEIFYRNKQKIMYENIFQKFTTPFWIKRQWFFAHDTNFGSPLRGIFYSVQPYKRKCFTLTGESNLDEHPSHDKTIFDSVHHVIIQDERMIENCSKYFPNANQLTISDQRTDRAKRSTIISIDDIIPLIQLTKLTIDYSHRPFSKVIDLLYSVPNVDTLVLKHLSLVATDYFPLQHSEKFRLVSNHNKIKNITILFDYSLRNIQLLMNLCPKVRQISFGISESYLESTVQFFVSETKKTNWYLSSICIFGVDTVINEKLKSLIESEKFINDYSIKIIGRTFYLWW